MVGLRIILDLLENPVNALNLKINKIVHKTLRFLCDLGEPIKIEPSTGGERKIHEGGEVDNHQTTRVVRAERDLTARVG